MTLIVTPKNKKEAEVIKAFLGSLKIGFYSEMEEDKALYKAMTEGRKSPKMNAKEQTDFFKRLKKG